MGCEIMRRNSKEVKGTYDYKVLNMCKHPCVCADKYAGISNHTIWQWGKPPSGMEFSTQDRPPQAPGRSGGDGKDGGQAIEWRR